jgi:ATP synthase F1 gamma subunit
MEQRAKLKQEITISKSLTLLTRAYQEHAIEQINFARYSVLASRDFVEQLIDIFSNVKASYIASLQAKGNHTDKDTPMPILKKNGKTALVLITANNKLYGDIIPKVSRLFEEEANKQPDTELILIGKQGKNYLSQTTIHRATAYFEIPDTNVSLATLKELTTTLLSYEKVTVFYGKFNNIISQDAVAATISGDIPEGQTNTSEGKDFLFEPSLPDVATFFENQIFSLIFTQTISEAQLGKFASRVKAMERAQNNMAKLLAELNKKEVRLKNMTLNKKQQEQIAGRSLWGHR